MTMRIPRRMFLGGCAVLLAGCAAPGPRRFTRRCRADGRILFAVNGSKDGKKNDGIYLLTNGGSAKRILAKDNAYALEYPAAARTEVPGSDGRPYRLC